MLTLTAVPWCLLPIKSEHHPSVLTLLPALLLATGSPNYWIALGDRIGAAETTHAALPAAIYGSGFYGAYIASLLGKPDRVEFFWTPVPSSKGKTLFGKAIISPPALPDHIRLLYIGLNPKIARATVAGMDWLHGRNLKLVFLDEEAPC